MRQGQVTDLGKVGAHETLEIGVQHHLAQLPRAVAAKVEEENAIALGDERARLLHTDQRGHEFIGLLYAVFVVHRFHHIIRVSAFAEENQLPRLFHALPTVVAIHREVAANHRRDLSCADLLQLGLEHGEIMFAAVGRGVAAVEKCVDENARQACILRRADERVEMFLVRVHAAVGKQAPQMQRAVAGLELREKFHQRRIGR